jgi:hypothetical protein
MLTVEDMDKKDVTIQIRCTAEEQKYWSQLAEAEDRTLSNWIRRQCNAELERVSLAKIAAQPDTVVPASVARDRARTTHRKASFKKGFDK